MKEKENMISVLSENFENKGISKIIISLKYSKNIVEYEKILIKPVHLKIGERLSFVYRYPTKDITKNLTIEEAKAELEELIGKAFFQVDMFLKNASHHLIIKKNGEGKYSIKKLDEERKVDLSHNKVKQRILEDAQFLNLLGVISNDGNLKKSKGDKYVQINKFLEFFEQAIKESGIENDFVVSDMGSGKGYLTFAMYFYLKNILNKNAKVTGIEFRPDMVELCNGYAKQAGFSGLGFKQGTIENADISGTNVLIALHACDTATDDAIFKGIEAGANVIMVAPCCHKQIRREIKLDSPMKSMLQHGIVIERQAEIVTDTIRSMILEANGYKTKVFEFISSEQTPKNMMITAIKTNEPLDATTIWLEINVLKNAFGIKMHYLESLLSKNAKK